MQIGHFDLFTAIHLHSQDIVLNTHIEFGFQLLLDCHVDLCIPGGLYHVVHTTQHLLHFFVPLLPLLPRLLVHGLRAGGRRVHRERSEEVALRVLGDDGGEEMGEEHHHPAEHGVVGGVVGGVEGGGVGEIVVEGSEHAMQEVTGGICVLGQS